MSTDARSTWKTFKWLYQGRGGRAKRRRRNFVRLFLEPLEDRTLPSASIFGSVFDDIVGSGAQQSTVAGQVAYLDLNHDGRLDNVVTTDMRPGGLSPRDQSAPNMVDLGGIFASTMHLGGYLMSAPPLDVAVTIDLTNNSPDSVPIALFSPTGLSSVLGTGDIFQGPYMFTIAPGQHFVGTFDGAATNPVNAQAAPVPNGTYAPQQSFSNPQLFIENVDPNGTWTLLFLPPSGSSAGLTLNSWSISFTQAEPSTTTDAAGNYSFTGLAAGTYTVGLVVPSGEKVTTPGGASQTVTVADGATQTGVDFGIEPLPDLTSVAFNVVSGATAWGQPITIDYTLTNQGPGTAAAFDVALLLSSSGVINPANPALGKPLHFTSLAAGASTSGTITVTLPAQAPAGFDADSPAADYVGFDIDPGNLVAESDKANNSNQGAGIDLALIGPQNDVAVTSGTGVQQSPALAVDPKNSQHIATAYMDYSLVQTGYAGIGIAVSSDGGQTWTHSSVPLPPGFDRGASGASDPAIAFDAQGNLYVSFLAVTFLGAAKPNLTDPATATQRAEGFQSHNGIFVAKSQDGGLTWAQPMAVNENSYTGTGTGAATADPAAVPFDAYPQLAIDTSAASPHQGSLYVTWTVFYPGSAAASQNQYPGGNPSKNIGGSDVMVAVSADGNSTWTTQTQTVGGIPVSAIRDPFFGGPSGGSAAVANGNVKFSWVTVGADGAVYVSTDTVGYFTVYSSTDGGHTFRAPLLGPYGGNYQGNPFDYTQTKVLPNATLDNFTTLRTRQIVADPTRPGVLYAVAPNSLGQAEAQPGGIVAANGIVFAVSYDYGASWTTNFTVGSEGSPVTALTPDQLNSSNYVPVLNDDNGGVYPGFASNPQTQVAANQAFPSITVSPQGVITVIWYDTRSDAANHNVEVWGTVSTDGGQHWSANFPVSNVPFDPNSGAFKDANGKTDFSLGSQIGVAASGGSAYAVWTDTRGGSQNILSTSYSLSTLPQAPVDRFAPDYTQASAANLGQVTAQQLVPRLNLLPGAADEWFQLTAGATGALSVYVAAAVPADLTVQLTDADGNVLPATVSNVTDGSGSVVGQALAAAVTSGEVVFVHVSGTSAGGIGYTLSVGTLTADLGSPVEGSKTDSVPAGGQNIYRLVAAVQGTLQVSLTAGTGQQGNLNLQILGADGQSVLASDLAGVAPGTTETLNLSVTQGQVVFLQISGMNLASSDGSFTLSFANFDQFETPPPANVPDTKSDNLGAGGFNFYEVIAGATTSFTTTLTASSDVVGNLSLQIYDSSQNNLLGGSTSSGPGAGQSTQATLAVTPGEVFYVVVTGVDGSSAGDYTVQYSPQVTSSLQTLFFPTSSTPTSLAAADLTNNGVLDLVAGGANAPLSVLMGNGDGTFQAEKQFTVGPNPGGRQVAVANLNGDNIPDIVVPNSGSADVSVLLGNGDGTYQPQRRFDAMAHDTGLVSGDFTGGGITDLVVLQSFQAVGTAPVQIAYLQGRGDGTFLPPVIYNTAFTGGDGGGPMVAGDFGNGHLDVIVFSRNHPLAQIFWGDGQGHFTDGGTFATGESTSAAQAVDLGNGQLDLITTGANTGNVYVMMGNGDGTFAPSIAYQAMLLHNGGNVTINGLTVVDFGSPTAPGTPDGNLDIIVTAAPQSGGAAEVIMLPGLDHQGDFGDPVVLANVAVTGPVVAGTFAAGGGTDLAVADKGGITIIYGSPLTLAPPMAPQDARVLGNADHVTTLPQSIVTGHEDAYFTYVAPTESVAGAGAQVVDISALFANLAGTGLSMVVTDPAGNQYTGPRLRIVAAQGAVLTIHIFGNTSSGGLQGAGTYALDIDVLPQVVGIQAESADPAISAITSLVVTLQGDRLDPTAAQDPANYTLQLFAWTGPQIITPSSIQYDAGASLQPGSGLYYPAAARQTITLYFDSPLETGTYRLEFSSSLKTANISSDENDLLVPLVGFYGHPVVFVKGQQVTEGTRVVFNLSAAGGSDSDVNSWQNGTPFFQQSYDNLGALLDSLLAAQGDSPTISSEINSAVLGQFYPGVQAAGPSSQALAIIWVDPVSIDLADAGGNRAVFDLQSNTVVNNLTNTFIEVGSNIQMIVMSATAGSFSLNLGDVGATARGGVVMLTPGQTQTMTLTDAIRGGDTAFTLNVPQVGGGNSPGTGGNPPTSGNPSSETLSLSSSPGSVGLTGFPPGTSALQRLLATLAVGILQVAATSGNLTVNRASDASTTLIVGDEEREGVVDWVTAIFAPVEGARGAVDAVLGVMGLPPVPLPDLRLQETLRDIAGGAMRLGGDAAAHVEGWLRTRFTDNGRPAGAVQAVPPAPMAQPNNDEDDDEVSGLFGSRDDLALAAEGDKLDGLLVAALFAAGAFYGATSEEQEALRKQRKAPGKKPRTLDDSRD